MADEGGATGLFRKIEGARSPWLDTWAKRVGLVAGAVIALITLGGYGVRWTWGGFTWAVSQVDESHVGHVESELIEVRGLLVELREGINSVHVNTERDQCIQRYRRDDGSIRLDVLENECSEAAIRARLVAESVIEESARMTEDPVARPAEEERGPPPP